MSINLDELQTALTEWPEANYSSRNEEGLLDRIFQILARSQTQPNETSWHADLQPLLRHALLQLSNSAGTSVRLRVPANERWPNRDNWLTHEVEAIETANRSAYLLKALDWHPEWLGGGKDGVFADAYSQAIVRRRTHCQVDPFIQDATGFNNYSSSGQREAVRAAFLIPQGETLIVNLPTGSGKSLVGQAPSLVYKEDGHLTIFVVPTIALAIDQERVMRQLFQRNATSRSNWPLAWHSGLSKEQRSEVRRRLREGTQRLLFTSPEALTTSLLGAISDAARNGILRYLVIDEAHLTTQWGHEFRPSFQALAGLRNSLLRLSPHGFRTILMSATLTEDTIETLANLFGPPEKVQMVSAVHLRPEPQYWFYKAASKAEKQERVLEALRHAPRPFILYVTQRKEVKEWYSILRTQGGLRRIATFDGETPPHERQRVIDEWTANRLDGIVATSAFGVGLDKNDVRTVIHATIPETLDRFYQEVGRGGRDGRTSVSLLIFDDRDWLLPERLAKPRIISDELGFNRWKAMFHTGHQSTRDELLKINIDAVPEHLSGGSEYNVSWNMRTLNLMVRAGLIALEIDVNSDEQEFDSEEDAIPILASMANVRVRILNHGHLTHDVWETLVIPSREKTLEAASRNLQMMRRLLPQSIGFDQEIGQEVGTTLAALYRIRSTSWPVQVTHVCGGCPKDRFDNETHGHYSEPIAVPVSRIASPSTSVWHETFPWINPSFAYIFYDNDTDLDSTRHAILQFASWIIRSCGVRELATAPGSEMAAHNEWHELYRQANDGILFHQSTHNFELEPYSPLSRLSVLEFDTTAETLLEIQMLRRPFHIVLLPVETADPANSDRRLVDVSPNALLLKNTLPVISQ